MINTRKTAIVVAVLFIIATVASIIAALMTGPILAESDYLRAVSNNANTMILAVLFMLIAAGSIAGIPITLFPIIKRHDETMAFWFLGARFFEAIIYAIGAIFTLSLLFLAREYTGSSTSNAPHFQTIGAVIRATSDAAFNIGTVIVFSLSAVILSIIFYRTNLVPRWLSVWKFVGGVLLFIQGILVVFDAATPVLEATLFIPIAVNEMVLAVWLIVKGFNVPALDALSIAAKPSN